jgi:hypothetical protein
MASSSSTRFGFAELRVGILSVSSSGDVASLPKLCNSRTPHMLSSALQEYSVQVRPTSCCRLTMRLLDPGPRAGSEMAATSACSVGVTRVV